MPAAGGVLAGGDGGGGDGGVAEQGGLDLAGLDAEAADLDLVVGAAQVLQLAACFPFARTVQRARSPVAYMRAPGGP